jgi:uncharacterized protein
VIIDAWIQHPTGPMLGDPMFSSLRRWMGITDVPDVIPTSFTLDTVEAAGIDIALASAWLGPQGALISNEQVAALVKEAPDRIVGVASVDLRDPMEAVRTLRYWVKKGFRGLRILPWLWQIPPDDRRYYPLYAECIELGVPFCTQVGHAGPLMPSEPGRPIPYLEQVAYEWPELTIVGGHLGHPWTDEMLSLLRKYDNVYVDTSAWKPSRFPTEFTRYLKGSGRKKVLYGSNWPMIPPSACLSQVDDLGLDDETRALFLGGNAARVFGLEDRCG